MKKYMILIVVVFVCFLFGCAEEQQVVKKPATSPNLMGADQKSPPVIKPAKEIKDVLHFMTFRTEPLGAGIYVIDALTGKEVGYLGTTPIRILIMKKKVEVDGFYANCTGLTPTVAGLTLTGKSGKVEQIEFQFKFRLHGFYDEIKIERLPLNSAGDTDITTLINLNPINGKK
jgi:hypothetical protein